MNVDIQKKQESVQQDLQSMQISLETLKKSLDKDTTLATKQECITLMKDIVQQMSTIEATDSIIDLQKKLEQNNNISPEVLQDIINSFIVLKLHYTESVVDSEAEQLLEKYSGLVSKKSELDSLLVSLQTPSTYQVQPQANVPAASNPSSNTPAVDPEKKEDGWLMRNTKAIFSKEERQKDRKSNALRTASGLAIAGGAVRGMKKLFSWMSGDSKEKSSSSNDTSEKTPWYKKWYTWAGVGLAGLLGWRYRGDITGWLDGLFGGEKSKKDAFGKEIADALGDGWKYDTNTNKFYHANKEYKWEDFVEKGLIHTSIDASGKTSLDKSKTVQAIKDYVKQDVTTQPNNKKLVTSVEDSVKDYESLATGEKDSYDRLGSQINDFYKDWYNTQTDVLGTHLHENGKRGTMLYHLNKSYGNIGTLLQQDTFPNFRNATTKDMLQTIMQYFPKPFVDALYGAASAAGIVGFDQLAQDASRLSEFIDGLKPADELKVKGLCVSLYNQWTAIAYYVLAVRDAYADRVSNDVSKLALFEQQSLLGLDKNSQEDLDVLYAIDNPKKDTDVQKRIEKRNKDEKKLLKKLDNAKSIEEQRKVVESLIGEIDDVGYHSWSAAFGLIWGHVWEKQSYLEYDVVSDMYEQYMGDQKQELQALLKKPNLTPDDINNIRQHITDFYATMKQVSTQVELRQETDDDGNLVTAWKIPIMKAGKLQYQVFTSHLENGQWVLAGMTLAVADLASYPLRKLIPHSGMRKFASLSPTVWTLKKLGVPVMKFGLGSALQAGEHILRTPIRNVNQFRNTFKLSRSLRFKDMDSLQKALHKSHIRLDDAAELMTGRAKGQTLSGLSHEWFGRQWKNMGFRPDDIEWNKMQLLRENARVKKNILPDGRGATAITADLETLAKHWDNKVVIEARRMALNGTELQKVLESLRLGTVGKGAEVVARAASNTSSIERAGSSVDDLSTRIARSQADVEKLTKKAFLDFETELAEQASKKGFKPGTKQYVELTESLWNSSHYGGNANLQKAIAEHNDLVAKTEQSILKQFNKSSWTTKQKMYADNPIVKSLVDANGGIETWKVPGFGRTGRMISVGVHAVMLGWIGSSDNADGNKKDRGEVGVDAADFGLGMIPVAGGLYDIGMAIRGKDLNGRDMGIGERFIRGGVGAVTGVLDVFTFGLGGTAIRTVAKGGTRVLLKSGGKKIVAESTADVVSKGFTQGAFKQIAKSSATNILVGTTAGLALVPAFDSLQSVPLDDNE